MRDEVRETRVLILEVERDEDEEDAEDEDEEDAEEEEEEAEEEEEEVEEEMEGRVEAAARLAETAWNTHNELGTIRTRPSGWIAMAAAKQRRPPRFFGRFKSS